MSFLEISIIFFPPRKSLCRIPLLHVLAESNRPDKREFCGIFAEKKYHLRIFNSQKLYRYLVHIKNSRTILICPHHQWSSCNTKTSHTADEPIRIKSNPSFSHKYYADDTIYISHYKKNRNKTRLLASMYTIIKIISGTNHSIINDVQKHQHFSVFNHIIRDNPSTNVENKKYFM